MAVKQGEKMVAADITDLTFFPIGTILMMDGSWQDGRGGWYICDGRSTPYGNTPNLRNKFLRGDTSSGTRTDGADSRSIALTTANLPSHNHTLSGLSLSGLSATSAGAHGHTFSNGSAASDGEHTHQADGWGGLTDNFSSSANGTAGNRSAMKCNIDSTLPTTSSGEHTHTVTGTISNTDGSHTHTITGTLSGGTISSEGSGTAFTVNTIPSYYAVIYIKKMA